MIELQLARPGDIPHFVAMEREKDTREFVIGYDEERHRRAMADLNVRYLRIADEGVLVGFIILVLDKDGSVELRRIVVTRKGAGIGQRAIAIVEGFCRAALGVSRIWLDVFEHNHRGRRLYEKLGYSQFGVGAFEGRRLLLYEKQL